MLSSVLWGQAIVNFVDTREAQTFESGQKDAWEEPWEEHWSGVWEASGKELANGESLGVWARANDWEGVPAVSSGRCQMACGAVSARQNLVSRGSARTSPVRKRPNRRAREEQGTRHKERGARSRKSKDHRLPSETDDDVIATLGGSRKSILDVFNINTYGVG